MNRFVAWYCVQKQQLNKFHRGVTFSTEGHMWYMKHVVAMFRSVYMLCVFRANGFLFSLTIQNVSCLYEESIITCGVFPCMNLLSEVIAEIGAT